jgi:hypothetical protein
MASKTLLQVEYMGYELLDRLPPDVSIISFRSQGLL